MKFLTSTCAQLLALIILMITLAISTAALSLWATTPAPAARDNQTNAQPAAQTLVAAE